MASLAGSLVRPYHFRDVGELAEAFAAWDLRLSQLRRETASGWTASGKLDTLSFWTSGLGGAYRLNAGVPRDLVLFHIDFAATASRRLGGMAVAGNDIIVGPGGAELDCVLTGPHHGLSLMMPVDLLNETLQVRAPDVAPPTASPYVLSVSAARVAALRHLAGMALDARPTTERHAASSVTDMLVNILLASLRRETDADWRPPLHHRRHILRRTEEFMHSNLGNPIMLRDLCHVAQASQRVLEYAFSTVYGMGPLQFLKRLRLNEVRRVLKSRSHDFDTIASIAMRHGFWHMGHFGADYRKLFGESPSDTRRCAVASSGQGAAHVDVAMQVAERLAARRQT